MDTRDTPAPAAEAPSRVVVPLDVPSEPLRPVVTTAEALNAAADALAAGTGPVAIDAERASGYRYGAEAYLVQLRRAGAGTFLIDPVPFADLRPVRDALGDTEWVLHAASQDLPCLRALELTPGGELFDTELGARLTGRPRVGLAAITEDLLGLRLAKEHSAVDWSVRPLQPSWLTYAALDVEVLVDLRDALAEELAQQGKLEWARQEFEAVRDAAPAPARQDPWRRTSGSHTLRTARQLAVLRALWNSRDDLARRRDLAPGRVLPDRALVAAAAAMPRTVEELLAVPPFDGPNLRRHAGRWWEAVEAGLSLPDDRLPRQHRTATGPPPPRVWRQKAPHAWERLIAAREHMNRLSQEHRVPVENLLTPDLLRRLCWSPPADVSVDGVGTVLREAGARPWQVELAVPGLSQVLRQHPEPPTSPEPGDGRLLSTTDQVTAQ